MTSIRPRWKFIYKLWVDDAPHPGMVCIRRDDKGFDSLRFYEANRIENWPNGITFYIEYQSDEDILIGGIHWVLFSDRFRQAIEQCQIPCVQFLPVWVEENVTGKIIGQYWVMNVTTAIEALDWERTRWLYPDRVGADEYPVLNIVKEALKSDIVGDVDIFRLRVIGKDSTNIVTAQAADAAGTTRQGG
jgi:hypothetical protein